LTQIKEYLYKKVSPFFKNIRSCPDRPDSLSINEQYDTETKVSFSITYNPEGKGFGGSYLSFNTVMDIERHILWRRLIEKSKQFALASEECPRVLFICDGGCDALYKSFRGASEYYLDEVFDHFWKRQEFKDEQWIWITEKGISVVVVLPIKSVNKSLGFMDRREFMIDAQFYFNPYCKFPLNNMSTKLLKQVILRLPAPIESPINALNAAGVNPIKSRYLGGLKMSDKSIEISAIELLQILSGRLSLEDFCRNYNLHSNPFNDALMRFKTIKSLKVEPVVDRDDDKVIIEFNTYDAAIGPFKVFDDAKS
jgi:hypothetical protein